MKNELKTCTLKLIFMSPLPLFTLHLCMLRLIEIRGKECIINWLQASGQQCLL